MTGLENTTPVFVTCCSRTRVPNILPRMVFFIPPIAPTATCHLWMEKDKIEKKERDRPSLWTTLYR